MAEASFTLTAQIVPVLDARTIQVEADKLSALLQQRLSKSLKVTPEFDVTKHSRAQFELARSIAKTNREAAQQEGFFNKARAAGVTFADDTRSGFLRLTDSIGATDRSVTGYGNTVRGTIKDTRRFRTALEGVTTAGIGLKDLPKSFATMQAQVIAGVSPLQQAAAAGDQFSKSLAPFLILGVTLARTLDKVAYSLQRIHANTILFRNAFLSFEQIFPQAAKGMAKDAERLRAVYADLIKTATDPTLKDRLIETFVESGGKALNLTNGLKALRTEFPQIKDDVDRALGGFDVSGIDKAKLKFRDLSKSVKSGARELSADINDAAKTINVEGAVRRIRPEFQAIFQSIKEDFKLFFRTAFGGGPKEKIRTTLFDQDAFIDQNKAQEQARKTAAAAYESWAQEIRARVRAARNNLLLFDPDVVLQQTRAAHENILKFASQQNMNRVAGMFQGPLQQGFKPLSSNFLEQMGVNAANIEAAGAKASSGFLRGFFDRFKSERGAASLGGLTSPFAALGKTASAGAGGIKSLTSSLGGLGSSLGPIGAAATAATAALAAFVGFGISAAIELETLNTALKGIFGGGAEAAFASINKFAAQTPFSLQSATTAVIKLGAAFEGLSADQAVALLKPFASAAAAIGATEDNINRAIIGISQMGAAGVVTADNMRQITEALPNVSRTAVIKELAKNMNLTESAARSLLMSGLLPAADGIKAIAQAAQNARGSQDALAKQAGTLTGRFSTFKDNLKVLVGISFAPLVSGLSNTLAVINKLFEYGFKALRSLIDLGSQLPFVGGKFAELKPKIEAVIGALDGTKGAADAAIPSLDAVALAITNLSNASGFSGQLAAVSGVFAAVNNKADEFNIKQGQLFQKTLASKGALEAQAQAARSVKDAQQALTDATREHDEQLAEQSIQLTKQLADARDALADSNQRVIDAQAALTEALKGANPDELERADLSLASAKLRLRQLIEDEKKALDELNRSQTTSFDITGLSLEQVKTRLKVVRATLAAQKQGKKADDKSGAQKEIDALQASIDRRTAELDIRDAEAATLELRKKGTELDPAVISARKEVLQAEKDRTKSLEAQQDVQAEINDLSKEDLDWTRQKQGLQRAITDAKIAQKNADRDAAIALAEAKGNQQELNNLLFAQIAESPKLLGILTTAKVTDDQRLDINRRLGIIIDENTAKVGAQNTALAGTNAQLADTIAKAGGLGNMKPITLPSAPLSPEAQSLLVNGVLPNMGNDLNNITRSTTGGLLEIASKALGEASAKQNILEAVVKNIAGRFGIRVPFAQGGVITRPTSALLGEAGREAVLPLTKPARLEALLADQRVQSPVMNALARISLPKPNVLSAPASSSLLPSQGTRSAGRGELRKERDAFAKAIAAELATVLQGSGDREFHLHQTVQHPDPQVVSRAVAREVKRQIEQLF